MKRKLLILFFCLISCLGIYTLAETTIAEEDQSEIHKVNFKTSLHHTAAGMKFWYDAENGGIELLNNISYEKMPCQKCHASSCESCHEKNTSDQFNFKKIPSQDVCLGCHGREAKIIQIDTKRGELDVHFSSGMECIDCHNSEDIHGDGNKYKTMKEAGAIKAECSNCHDDINLSLSHTVHNNKLECKACHQRHTVSCTNCHMDILLKENKKVAIPVHDWIFLINYKNQVTSATTQTYVVNENQTFAMFAPQHSHSIMKIGRACADCHATTIVKEQYQNKPIKLTWIENNKVENRKGVIPIIEDLEYDFTYKSYQDGTWELISKPKPPLIHYPCFGSPLSKDQLKKLLVDQNQDQSHEK